MNVLPASFFPVAGFSMREGKGVEVQDNEKGGAGEVGHKVG